MGRRIYIISPREPSGATWLINCLLELGIMTHRISDKPMWLEYKGRFTLSPHEELLKKWLPSLSARKDFKFRDDIDVVWTHEWPERKFNGHRIIYFVRDPRDAILSRYKRECPAHGYEAFLGFLDPYTLLNKVDNWCLFNRCWLLHPDLKVFRFEDYKKDAPSLLKEILAYMGLSYGDGSLNASIEASTSDRAAEAEERYRLEHPEDAEVINRGGKIGSWKELAPSTIELIERTAAGLFDRYDYRPIKKYPVVEHDYMPNIRLLSFFKGIEKLPEGGASDELKRLGEVVSFAHTLDKEAIANSSFRVWETRRLLLSLSEFMRNLQGEADERFSRLYNAENGTEYFVKLFELTGGVEREKLPISYRFKSALGMFRKE